MKNFICANKKFYYKWKVLFVQMDGLICTDGKFYLYKWKISSVQAKYLFIYLQTNEQLYCRISKSFYQPITFYECFQFFNFQRVPSSKSKSVTSLNFTLHVWIIFSFFFTESVSMFAAQSLLRVRREIYAILKKARSSIREH